MPKQVRAVVVGCGDIGSRVAVLLQQQGWQVYPQETPSPLP